MSESSGTEITPTSFEAIWYQNRSPGVMECLGLEVGVPKRFLRIWLPTGETDYGWVMHETAVRLWPNP